MFLKPVFPSFFLSKNEKLFEQYFITLCINTIIMSSSAHLFGCVKFLIFNIEYLLLFSAGRCSGKNVNKCSKFDTS